MKRDGGEVRVVRGVGWGRSSQVLKIFFQDLGVSLTWEAIGGFSAEAAAGRQGRGSRKSNCCHQVMDDSSLHQVVLVYMVRKGHILEIF